MKEDNTEVELNDALPEKEVEGQETTPTSLEVVNNVNGVFLVIDGKALSMTAEGAIFLAAKLQVACMDTARQIEEHNNLQTKLAQAQQNQPSIITPNG